MQEVPINTANQVFISGPAGVATRDLSGVAVDVTLDGEAAVAEILVLTSLAAPGPTAPINLNIPLNNIPQVNSPSNGVTNPGQGWRKIIRQNYTGAAVVTVRGVDLSGPLPVFGVGVALPLPAAATPNIAIYSTDGLNVHFEAAPSA